jgi:hypothetical protein
VRIGLVAATEAAYDRMEVALGVTPRARERVFRASDREAPGHVDLVVYETGMEAPAGAYTLDAEDPGATACEILRGHAELAPALARQFPGFRPAVLNNVIHEISRENAFFAVTTALPDLIPNLMEVPWAVGEWASDTAFITANQMRMAFLIAAACGREAGLARQKADVLAIAGAAFGWRAIARELAGKIPFGGGLVAKGAIAYAGTFLVGKGLVAFHHGHAFTAADRETAYQNGLERGRTAVAPIAGSVR